MNRLQKKVKKGFSHILGWRGESSPMSLLKVKFNSADCPFNSKFSLSAQKKAAYL